MNRLAATLVIFLGFLTCSAHEDWVLFHAPGANVEALLERVTSCLPDDVAVSPRELPRQSAKSEDLRVQCDALADGVRFLPCLVLRDEKGAYALLSLSGLTPKKIEQIRQLASSPGREELAEQRRVVATLFYLRALTCMPDVSEELRASALDRLEQMTELSTLSLQLRQFITLNCLYPALMQLYSERYDGTHTSQSEQIFRRAVGVLEKARDMDPLSHYGRIAYDLREQLRAARLHAQNFD